MSQIDSKRYAAMMTDGETPIASIYISLDSHDEDARESNRIRSKNARQALAAALDENDGVDEHNAEQMLKHFDALEANDERWDLHGAALAMAVTPDRATIQYLGHKVDDRVVVDRQFYLLPTLRGLRDRTMLAVLDLNQDAARLMALRETTFDPNLLNGASTRGAEAGEHHDVPLHGQGQAEHAGEERLRRWVGEVAEAVNHAMHNRDLPLVFAGHEELFGLYKQENQYWNFYSDTHVASLPKDPADESRAKEIRELLDDLEDKSNEKLASAVCSAVSHQKGSTSAKEIAKAGAEGRVEILLLADNLDESAGAHTLATTVTPEQARINEAVCAAVTTGAKIATVSGDQMPDGATIAAAYRY